MINITKKFATLAISTSLAFGVIAVAPINEQKIYAAVISKQEAIKKYNEYQTSYNKHEVPIIKAFEQQYDGSLAHQVVARAIWYMEHGYAVYNTAKYSETGMIDCSNYTKLVYGDFGINITSVSRQYNQVGTKINGVSSTKVGTSSTGQALYGIKGVENLKPGDILTFWDGTESNKYISHVAIYMGIINGKPAIINTAANRPTAIGIVNNFSYWYGEKLYEARRILPNDAWNPSAASKYTDSGPVIPKSYYLAPQKKIIMPTENNNTQTGNKLTITSNTVNIRSGPGTNYSIIGTYKKNDVITVINKTGSWLEVKTPSGKIGYIADWLASSTSNNNNTTSIDSSVVTGNVVNIRQSPTTNSKILGTVRKGDLVNITNKLDGWYEIDWNNTKAYISSNLISTTSNITKSQATVLGSIVNIRSGPGRQYAITSTVKNGDSVEIISNNNDWAKIKKGNSTGYIATWLLSI